MPLFSLNALLSVYFPTTEWAFLFSQSKSVTNGSDSADGDCKASPLRTKEHLSSIVREISQARLLSLRKKRSGQSMILSLSDNGNVKQIKYKY